MNGGNFHAADKTEVAFLDLYCRRDACDKRRLLFEPRNGCDVRRGFEYRIIGVVRFTVEDDEFHFRIFVLSCEYGGFEFEARADDQLIARIREVSDLFEIVGFRRSRRLEIFAFDAHIFLCAENAFPRALVE